MLKVTPLWLALVVLTSLNGLAVEPEPDAFLVTKLDAGLRELSELRDSISKAQVPMVQQLNALETETGLARKQFEETRRTLDTRSLEMGNLQNEIKGRDKEKSYLGTLLAEYIRNFEARLHIAELSPYQAVIEAGRLAPENTNLKPAAVFERQVEVVSSSLTRFEELLGGVRYGGQAAGPDGVVKQGQFVLFGPLAYFASDDGTLAGTADQRLGSLEPAVDGYSDPTFGPMTVAFVRDGRGTMPFDASLGNARKIEETHESLTEHIMKGGVVMYPIIALMGIVGLVAVIKWIGIVCVRVPGQRRLEPLFACVRQGDHVGAIEALRKLRGPAGRMLRVGVENMEEPKDLIEEVMFEKLMGTRASLNRALPFIAVSAASAPLLGLLGTVTGIINTFKLITVFGSGDVKMLSGGISEALITTEYGLIVAIPSILSHAFLSRMAKARIDRLERMAILFLSEVEKARPAPATAAQLAALADSLHLTTPFTMAHHAAATEDADDVLDADMHEPETEPDDGHESDLPPRIF